jgi:hypothetical protein
VLAADEVPPETTITSAPAGPTASGRVPFSFTADEPGSFECRVDEGPWAACASPFTTPPQTQGPHTFRVRAVDLAGNVDPTPATRDFLVDKSIAGANAWARRTQPQPKRTIAVAVTVTAAEPVAVSAAGSVAAGRHRIRLAGPTILAAAGTTQPIVLAPRSARDSRRVRKAMKRDGKVRATLTATFTDALGNTARTGDVIVKLKRG